MKKTQKMTSKSVPKSMKNRCEHDARKSDARIMENGAEMESKREPTSRNKLKNACQKRCRNLKPKKIKKMIKPIDPGSAKGRFLGGAGGLGGG